MFKKISLILLFTLLLCGCELNTSQPEKQVDEPIGGTPYVEPKPVILPDSEILDKDFKATLWNGDYASGEITFRVNYASFLGNNKEYNSEIAMFGAAMCNDLADEWCTVLDGVEYQDKLHKEIIYKEVGFEDVSIIDLKDNNYEVDANDTTRFALGHYPIVKDNTKYEVVIVNVCMTVGGAEWQSNLDIGADAVNYRKYYGENHPDWKNLNHHKGFDVCANRVSPYVDEYLKTKISEDENVILFITGYSRGAAIANILAANYTKTSKYKVFGYTYETPNTVCTEDDTISPYKNIYNICTSRDLIAKVPLASWGFKRYGVDIIKEVNPTTYRNLTGAEFNQTSPDAISHVDLLDCTRSEIYDKQFIIYNDFDVNFGNKTTCEYSYTEFKKYIDKLNNNEMFIISDLECDNDLYNFTITGSLCCFVEVLAYFIPNIDSLDTTALVELINYMMILNYYMPLFEDIINIVGFSFDKIQIVNPHYLLATVSVIQNYK